MVSFSLFFVIVMFSGLVFAQSGVVGVSEGDWFSYEFNFDWYSDEENMTMPEDIPIDYMLKGDFLRFDVSAVSGSNVTGQFEVNYQNGTEEIMVGWVDVATGEGKFSNWLISSDLEANDFTYPTEFGGMINETVMLSTPLGSRETNHIEYSFGTETEYGDDYYMFGVSVYWDKEMGILVEMSFESEMMTNGNLTTASGGWKLADSNVATIPEFSTFALVATFIVAAVTVFAIKKRMQQMKQQE